MLVGSMVLVTVNIWTGSPLLALWIGSRVAAVERSEHDSRWPSSP